MRSSASRRSREATPRISSSSCRTSSVAGKLAATWYERDRGLRSGLARDGGAADFLAFEDEDDAERFVVGQAAADHLAVSRLEKLQRQGRFREQDRVQREQRQPHEACEPTEDDKPSSLRM